MADFVAQHCGPELAVVDLVPWTLFFDGSTCGNGSAIGVVLILPRGATFEFSFPIEAYATNNQAEYRAILKGIQLHREIKADAVEIFRDSMLAINQLIGEYDCKDDILRVYHEECLQLLKEFKKVTIEHVPKFYNGNANRFAQHASGYRLMEGVMTLEFAVDDWRKEIVDYLKDPSKKVDRKVRFQAIKYVLLEGELYYRRIDGVLLRCLDKEEAKDLMGEIHEGVCGSHQSAYKMKWVIRRNEYFWPTILEDYFTYYKGC